MLVRRFFLLAITSFFISSAFVGVKSGKKVLEFSFRVNDKADIQPSYQMAIWLERPDGTYIRTLYISDWVSMGGFNDKRVCPNWNGKVDWRQVPWEEADAVTGATLLTEDQVLTFECSKKRMPPGRYKYFIEVHLLENYNELYSGEIEVGKEDTENVPEVVYIPEKHPKGGDILSNITVRCRKK